MNKVLSRCVVSMCAVVLFALGCPRVDGQGPVGWSAPVHLSDEQTFAMGPTLVLGRKGEVHAFWSSRPVDEPNALFALSHSVRRDDAWSPPEEVVMSPGGRSATTPRARVDSNNVLHLFWVTSGLVGELYYANAPAGQAHSARSWTTPQMLQPAVYQFDVATDPADNLHLMYASETEGLCHTQIALGQDRWAEPVCIPSCQTLREDEYDSRPRLGIGSSGILHAVWVVSDLSPSSLLAYAGRAICYAHSTDSGRSWSTPITIVERESREPLAQNQPEFPVIAVDSRERVHVVYVGHPGMFRYHVFSEDAGATWSQPQVAVGVGGYNNWMGLVAGNDDSVHLVCPAFQGLWYNRWDGEQWGHAALFPATSGAHYSDALMTPDGDLHAVWQDHGGGKATVGHILYVYLPAANGRSVANAGHQPATATPPPASPTASAPTLTPASESQPPGSAPVAETTVETSAAVSFTAPLTLAVLSVLVLLAGAFWVMRRR